jgi:hypothetical protein
MGKKKSPLRQALDLCDKTLYPYVTSQERVQAAHDALRLSEDCPTAYTILAWEHENAGDSWKALYLHERALAAAERALEAVRVRRRARRRRLFRKPEELSDGVPPWPLPESVEISADLVWVGRKDFQVLGPWGGKTDYALAHDRAQDLLYR